jgi:hypothetical protein
MQRSEGFVLPQLKDKECMVVQFYSKNLGEDLALRNGI